LWVGLVLWILVWEVDGLGEVQSKDEESRDGVGTGDVCDIDV